MPYIKDYRRWQLDDPDNLATPDDGGELNYAFTKIIKAYIDEHGMSYQHANDILGALSGAKLEFYRRMVVPYEEGKIKENGDVY